MNRVTRECFLWPSLVEKVSPHIIQDDHGSINASGIPLK